jgi:predicted metal-dependent phosphoesterase TrpH
MLLCELHAHTTWSDGELTLTELVDLYGMHGFDVLCVTDHLLRTEERSYRLRPETFPHYVKTIERESRRASELRPTAHSRR